MAPSVASVALARAGIDDAPVVGAAASVLAVPPPPGVSATAVFVQDASTGTPLYGLAADEPRPPASLTKIATAMVVLRHAGLRDVVTIETGDLADLSESQVGLIANDALTIRDLLFGLLVPSGNDAANALARHVGASLPGGDADPVGAFVGEMNAIAAEVGLTNTQFLNATGLHAEGHVASARDLALLAAAALADPLFAEIVATPFAQLTSARDPAQIYSVTNTNDLLLAGQVEGVKTGTTAEAGGCLITASVVGSNQVITVVLGSTTFLDETGALKSTERFADVSTILATLTDDYRWLDPTDPDVVAGLGDELAAWGATLPPGPAVVVPADRVADLRYRLMLGPPVAANDPVGKVVFLVGTDRLSERPVYQAADGAS